MGNKTDYRAKISDIRALMLQGKITVHEARAMAQPFIDEMNKSGEKVAKRFDRKFKPFTFAYLMR